MDGGKTQTRGRSAQGERTRTGELELVQRVVVGVEDAVHPHHLGHVVSAIQSEAVVHHPARLLPTEPVDREPLRVHVTDGERGERGCHTRALSVSRVGTGQGSGKVNLYAISQTAFLHIMI